MTKPFVFKDLKTGFHLPIFQFSYDKSLFERKDKEGVLSFLGCGWKDRIQA